MTLKKTSHKKDDKSDRSERETLVRNDRSKGKDGRVTKTFKASVEDAANEGQTLPERLLEALRLRILKDVGDDRFDPDNWSTTELGKHYEFIDEDIRLQTILTVLRESFEPVLQESSFDPVPDSKWDEFFDLVTGGDTPESALTTLTQVLVT